MTSPHFEVHADLPLDAAVIAVAVDVLEGVAEGARAVWGHATPSGYGGVVAQQFRHPGDEPHAARALGFPDPARDAELLSRARRTPMGGWVVQLTDAPLDLDNPTHLDALLRAYERFPEISGRSAP